MRHDIKYTWESAKALPSRRYVCGHCGSPVASEKGFRGARPNRKPEYTAFLYICHFCTRPTLFEHHGYTVPQPSFGGPIGGIDDPSVVALYNEARACTAAGASTAAVLCCRKLLMHVAVTKGAAENSSFREYVDFLGENNYVPPDARTWIDHIRKKGNEANHEIVLMKREDAEELLSFVEMLLRVVFEFPAKVRAKYGEPAETNSREGSTDSGG